MKQEEVLFVEENLLEPAVSFVDRLAGGVFLWSCYTFYFRSARGLLTKPEQQPAFSDSNLDTYACNSES